MTTNTTPELTADERLAQIRDRNHYLRDIPFETHGPGVHGDNCPPCAMVRGIGDVSWLLELVDEQQREAFATALDTGPAVWCWNRHPDHPLHCGRFAGHEGPHIRGERRWEDAAEQQPEDGGDPR